MKKKILFLTSMLIAANAFAGVEIFGLTGWTVMSGKIMGNSTFAINSPNARGQPRIGFRGEDDLGGGLKAFFVLEQMFNLDTGKSAEMSTIDSQLQGSDVFTSQAFVGIKGEFGQFALGRQIAPGYYMYDYDPILGSGPSTIVQQTNFYGNSIALNSQAHWNNAISYKNTWQTIEFYGIYSMGNQETDSAQIKKSDDDKFGLSVKYSDGPIKFGVIYHNLRYNQKPFDATQKEFLFGLSYDIGDFSLRGSYLNAKDTLGIKGRNIDIVTGGFIYRINERDTFHVSISKGSIDSEVLDKFHPATYTVYAERRFAKRVWIGVGYSITNYDDMTWGEGQILKLTPPMGHLPSDKVANTSLLSVVMRYMF